MTRTGRGLIPLYAASTLLMVGEGGFQLLTPPYMHEHGISSFVIGIAVSAYASCRSRCACPSAACIARTARGR